MMSDNTENSQIPQHGLRRINLADCRILVNGQPLVSEKVSLPPETKFEAHFENVHFAQEEVAALLECFDNHFSNIGETEANAFREFVRLHTPREFARLHMPNIDSPNLS